MQNDDIAPDSYTYAIILNGLKLNDSSMSLVRSSLESIKKVIEVEEFQLDEIFFNTILDVCCKYELINYLEYFHKTMVKKNIPESNVTFGILIKAYSKRN